MNTSTILGTIVHRRWQADQPVSVIGSIETSETGNVILRIGRADPVTGEWHQTEHVVLTPPEALRLVERVAVRL